MSFRLVRKSVTLNDLERRNGPYFALFHRIFVYDVIVKQLLGLPRFQNLLLIVYNHIKTICTIIQQLFGQNKLITQSDRCRYTDDCYVHRYSIDINSRNQEVGSVGVGAGLYMCDAVVKKFTFAISSPDKFLYYMVLKHVPSKKLILGHSTVIDCLFMKQFRTNNMDTVRQCQQFFNFDLPSLV